MNSLPNSQHSFTLPSLFFSPEGMDCTVDEFLVDELLDFSNNCSTENEEHPQGYNGKKPEKVEAENVTNLSGKQDFGELHFPENDEDNLEWLAHFVEDSFTYTAGKLPNQGEMKTPVQDSKSCFTTPVQTGSRTKRTTAARVWSLSLTESASTSSSSSSTTTTMSFSLSPCIVHTAESIVRKPAANKRRKKAAGGGVQPRRCSHCGVQKTPQWRAGPMGAKTLCNACGVRFKSGRLLPEYRPACSPTFSTQLHSNNHRKVLEMRRKMEVEGGGLARPGSEFLKN
ncbi:GATA transcription factor 5-like [Nicotiana tomentosiformis]|uniref:GATA transcription factor n=1 Tax=Nicotiana tabacum TaxID=4097 RepID=A0A1S4A235_TOBAC|nr:GATA transcription factor 5-like [Nicotiana tomentosiformis]XP_016470693.1 PREDICTED: GATA transcription factor 5-like [Nicotiana tabacum]